MKRYQMRYALIFIGYYMAMVCQEPVLAHLRQYWPEGFNPSML